MRAEKWAVPLTVKCLTPAQSARWDAFVQTCPQASFFHRSAWAGLIEQHFGHRTYFLFAERAGLIEGVLPLAHVNSWLTGRGLVSLPFCVEAGVAALNTEAAAALETEALRIAAQLGAARLELRHARTTHEDWPTQSLYVRFAKPLAASDEDNLKAIPRKQRAVVRKGIEGGLCARLESEFTCFYRLYADNQRRHGTPVLGRDFFAGLMAAFGDDCEVLTVVGRDGAPLSSVLSFYFRDQVMPYYAGDVPQARALHANDFKYWALMQRAVQRGATVFDYGRSKVGSGSYAFKKNWGFEPEPLFYEFRFLDGTQAVPQHNPANPKYRLFIETWKRLPQALANRLGPHIVRHFG